MPNNQSWAAILPLLSPAYALTAYAEVYLTDQQAMANIFAGQTMQKTTVQLSDDEAKKIAEQSKETVRSKEITVWKSKSGDVVFIDQVLGKHEFITYAVGVKKDGRVKAIEILEYRESYGHQVRQESWRKQFTDKTSAAPLKLDEDIKNLSGATLSSAHITAGVRRILHTYDTIKSRI